MPAREHMKALANSLIRQNKLHEARALYQQICQANESDAEDWFNLSAINGLLGLLEEAANCCHQAIRMRPNFTEAHHNLGNVLQSLGRNKEAAESYRRALQISPALLPAQLGEIHALETMGDMDDAYSRLQPLLSANMGDADVALAFADLCSHGNRCGEAMDRMERLLIQNNPPLGKHYQMRLHFSLGKLHDKNKKYDTAFLHFQQANTLDGRRFDPQKYKRNIDQLIAAYSTSFLTKPPQATLRSERPIFIVGMPRSGTSLTEQILATHSQVYGGGELDEIAKIAASLPQQSGLNQPYPQCLDELTSEHCDHAAQRYLDRIGGLCSDALRVTDKRPQNFQQLGLITLLFPNARIIHCVRDPLDTCLSCYFQDFDKSNHYAYDLHNLGFYYRQYQRLMDHWKSVLNVPLMEVPYEELVNNQEAVSRAIMEFCSLEWEDNCLQFHDNPRFVQTLSYQQVRRPMYSTSISRWKHYQQYLEPLRVGLADE